jgi:hypothetical protein
MYSYVRADLERMSASLINLRRPCGPYISKVKSLLSGTKFPRVHISPGKPNNCKIPHGNVLHKNTKIPRQTINKKNNTATNTD